MHILHYVQAGAWVKLYCDVMVENHVCVSNYCNIYGYTYVQVIYFTNNMVKMTQIELTFAVLQYSLSRIIFQIFCSIFAILVVLLQKYLGEAMKFRKIKFDQKTHHFD